MTTYNIKLVSQLNAGMLILAFCIVFIGGVFIFIPHGIHNKALAYLLVLTMFGIWYVMWQKLVTGRTKWTMDDQRICVEWTKQFAFASKENIMIQWSEIQRISTEMDPNYNIFKIKLFSGRTFRFIHDPLVTRDDFQNFFSELGRRYKIT